MLLVRSRCHRACRTSFFVAIGWLSAPGPASAQSVGSDPGAGAEAPSPGQSQPIVPPKLISDPGVAYPEQALSERFYARVEVALLIELDRSGNVVSTMIEALQGHGFDEAAQAAALQLRFEPALRDGVPVASRIRYRYIFEPPPVTPVSEQQTPVVLPPRVPAAETARRDEQPVEITVQGEQAEPTVVTLQREEVRRTPGALGDGFRAIEVLPGVTPVVSGFPFFFVRGGPPGNVGYVVDGVRVPTVYHVAFGPSVLPPGLVERFDLYPGAYPARYGRFAGAIVSAETTAPRPDLHGEASTRLFDAGAFAESGFAEGRGTILLGGRYSYTAALISLLASNVKADYRDFQTPAFEVHPAPGGRWEALESGPTVRLAAKSGRVEIAVHKLTTGQRFLVTLPDGELEVKGTRFVVTTAEERTLAVEVTEGRVALRLKGRPEVMLTAGERWPVSSTTGPGLVEVAGTQPRATRSQVIPEPAASIRAAEHRSEEAPTIEPRSPSDSELARPIVAAGGLDAALAAYEAGQFARAEQLFAAFVQGSPGDARAEDATFLMALCRARLGDGGGAQLAARRYLERYPRGLRRAEAEQIAAGQ